MLRDETEKESSNKKIKNKTNSNKKIKIKSSIK
jgi:hypothetical protein